MIKYLGSKRILVPTIDAIVENLPDVSSACDVFTGTTRVAQALKQRGLSVWANDSAIYAWQLARVFVEIDRRDCDLPHLQKLIDVLNALPGEDGYVTQTFATEARFFHPDNARRIDAIRRRIDDVARDDDERSILLVALMLAADRVDSTTGLQMAYLKAWAARALKPMRLRIPALLDGSGRASCCDANELVASGATKNVDLAYLDPPYNQHSYTANYHIWETLMRGDEPESYGVARKRIDTRSNKSDYNSSRKFASVFSDLVGGIESPWILASFSNEGFIAADDIAQLLSSRREVLRLDVEFPRYVGARIGIYNPGGEKVGKVSHTRNVEHLFLAGPKDRIGDVGIRLGMTAANVATMTTTRDTSR